MDGPRVSRRQAGPGTEDFQVPSVEAGSRAVTTRWDGASQDTGRRWAVEAKPGQELSATAFLLPWADTKPKGPVAGAVAGMHLSSG